jgi:acyl-[acyl-carrier-protein]-phospholipid O-acyltransferase/long-chain-fatty-acid--[acyl-carrier-protein] ligase
MPTVREWLIVLGVVVALPTLWAATLPWTIQVTLRVLLWPRYRLRIIGREHVPRSGPALLASNHTTWIDGFILAATCPRRGKALVNSTYINLPIFRQLAIWAGIIPIPAATGPRALRAAINAARQALDRGEVIGVFPEGQLTRTGLTGPFLRGIEVILQGHEHVPLIPIAMDNLWGSIFSNSEGRFFRKWPKGWRRTVNVIYGPPVPPPITAFQVRQAVLEAGVQAFALRKGSRQPPETVDPNLPHLDHPELGALTGSTANSEGYVKQLGQKPGTVGLPLPGVAIRTVDDAGNPLPPDTEGRLQALVAGRAGWTDIGHRGSLDRDGFVHLAGSA